VEKSSIGRLAIILGGLVFSIQLYGLKMIQGIEMQAGTWQTNAMSYGTESPILLSLLITVAIILYGIVLVIGTDKIKKYFIVEAR